MANEGRGAFSAKVKEELLAVTGVPRHCAAAELAGIYFAGGKKTEEGLLLVSSENETVARKVFTLLGKAFNISVDISKRRKPHAKLRFEVILSDPGRIRVLEKTFESEGICKRDCCARAFLRGAFLAAGTISDPERSYRAELVSETEESAKELQSRMQRFALRPKMTKRKNGYVTYLQDGDQVVDFINVIGAHNALMELENVRIVREMRGSISRRVNCEASNLSKTAKAAAKQRKAIAYLAEHGYLHALPESLREIAEARLASPDASLSELGEAMHPPLGRSGVNHRLRKLCELAEEYRKKETAFQGPMGK